MSDVADILLAIVAIPSMLIAVVALPCVLFFAVQAARHVKPGVRVWGSETQWNPFNVLSFPRLLSDEGLKHRRRCFLAIVCFIAPILLTLALAALTGQLE